MPRFTGQSINLSIQEAFEDALQQALIAKPLEVHDTVNRVTITRIYAERHGEGSIRNMFVEVEAE